MGRQNVPMTRRSHSAGGISLARRPKRNVSIKTYDDTVGLSRTEERELKKALYASLQESKRLYRYQQECDEKPMSHSSHVPLVQRPTRPMRSRSWPHTPSQCSTATPSTNASVDESSQDSVKSSVSSVAELKNKQERKIHAQRKFAQGSLPPTPSTTPVKVKASPIKLLPRTAKTEDFLTFLCLRGSSVLPPHLDFFNFSRGEPSHGEISAPQTPPPSETTSKPSERTRESTPESSSVSTNDELYEIGTPSPSSLIVNGRNGLSARKAARASASTPETARGIVSLSQGLNKKSTRVSTPHRGRKYGSVERTPSPRKGSPLVRGQLTPSKRGFAVKSLSPQFSKTAQEKKLSLKQKPLLSFLPHKTSTKHGTVSGKAAGSKQLLLGAREQVNNQVVCSPAARRRSTRLQSVNACSKCTVCTDQSAFCSPSSHITCTGSVANRPSNKSRDKCRGKDKDTKCNKLVDGCVLCRVENLPSKTCFADSVCQISDTEETNDSVPDTSFIRVPMSEVVIFKSSDDETIGENKHQFKKPKITSVSKNRRLQETVEKLWLRNRQCTDIRTDKMKCDFTSKATPGYYDWRNTDDEKNACSGDGLVHNRHIPVYGQRRSGEQRMYWECGQLYDKLRRSCLTEVNSFDGPKGRNTCHVSSEHCSSQDISCSSESSKHSVVDWPSTMQEEKVGVTLEINAETQSSGEVVPKVKTSGCCTWDRRPSFHFGKRDDGGKKETLEKFLLLGEQSEKIKSVKTAEMKRKEVENSECEVEDSSHQEALYRRELKVNGSSEKNIGEGGTDKTHSVEKNGHIESNEWYPVTEIESGRLENTIAINSASNLDEEEKIVRTRNVLMDRKTSSQMSLWPLSFKTVFENPIHIQQEIHDNQINDTLSGGTQDPQEGKLSPLPNAFMKICSIEQRRQDPDSQFGGGVERIVQPDTEEYALGRHENFQHLSMVDYSQLFQAESVPYQDQVVPHILLETETQCEGDTKGTEVVEVSFIEEDGSECHVTIYTGKENPNSKINQREYFGLNKLSASDVKSDPKNLGFDLGKALEFQTQEEKQLDPRFVSDVGELLHEFESSLPSKLSRGDSSGGKGYGTEPLEIKDSSFEDYIHNLPSECLIDKSKVSSTNISPSSGSSSLPSLLEDSSDFRQMGHCDHPITTVKLLTSSENCQFGQEKSLTDEIKSVPGCLFHLAQRDSDLDQYQLLRMEQGHPDVMDDKSVHAATEVGQDSVQLGLDLSHCLDTKQTLMHENISDQEDFDSDNELLMAPSDTCDFSDLVWLPFSVTTNDTCVQPVVYSPQQQQADIIIKDTEEMCHDVFLSTVIERNIKSGVSGTCSMYRGNLNSSAAQEKVGEPCGLIDQPPQLDYAYSDFEDPHGGGTCPALQKLVNTESCLPLTERATAAKTYARMDPVGYDSCQEKPFQRGAQFATKISMNDKKHYSSSLTTSTYHGKTSSKRHFADIPVYPWPPACSDRINDIVQDVETKSQKRDAVYMQTFHNPQTVPSQASHFNKIVQAGHDIFPKYISQTKLLHPTECPKPLFVPLNQGMSLSASSSQKQFIPLDTMICVDHVPFSSEQPQKELGSVANRTEKSKSLDGDLIDGSREMLEKKSTDLSFRSQQTRNHPEVLSLSGGKISQTCPPIDLFCKSRTPKKVTHRNPNFMEAKLQKQQDTNGERSKTMNETSQPWYTDRSKNNRFQEGDISVVPGRRSKPFVIRVLESPMEKSTKSHGLLTGVCQPLTRAPQGKILCATEIGKLGCVTSPSKQDNLTREIGDVDHLQTDICGTGSGIRVLSDQCHFQMDKSRTEGSRMEIKCEVKEKTKVDETPVYGAPEDIESEYAESNIYPRYLTKTTLETDDKTPVGGYSEELKVKSESCQSVSDMVQKVREYKKQMKMRKLRQSDERHEMTLLRSKMLDVNRKTSNSDWITKQKQNFLPQKKFQKERLNQKLHPLPKLTESRRKELVTQNLLREGNELDCIPFFKREQNSVCSKAADDRLEAEGKLKVGSGSSPSENLKFKSSPVSFMGENENGKFDVGCQTTFICEDEEASETDEMGSLGMSDSEERKENSLQKHGMFCGPGDTEINAFTLIKQICGARQLEEQKSELKTNSTDSDKAEYLCCKKGNDKVVVRPQTKARKMTNFLHKMLNNKSFQVPSKFTGDRAFKKTVMFNPRKAKHALDSITNSVLQDVSICQNKLKKEGSSMSDSGSDQGERPKSSYVKNMESVSPRILSARTVTTPTDTDLMLTKDISSLNKVKCSVLGWTKPNATYSQQLLQQPCLKEVSHHSNQADLTCLGNSASNPSTVHTPHRLFPSPPSVMSCGICEGSQTFKPVSVSSDRKSSSDTSKRLKSKLKTKKEMVKQKLSAKVKKKAFMKSKLKTKSKVGKRQKGCLEEHPRKKRIVRRTSLRLKELTKARKAERKRRRAPVEVEEEDEVTFQPHSRPVGKKRNFAPRPVSGEVAEMPRAVTEEFDFEMYTDDEDEEVSFGNVSSSFRRTFCSKKSVKESSKKVKSRKVGMSTRSSSQKVMVSPAKIVASKCLSAVKKLRASKGDQMKLSKIIERRRKLKHEDGKGESLKRGRKPIAKIPGVKKPSSPEKQSRLDTSSRCDQSSLLEVPTFRPTEEEFRDPIQYIESIREKAEPYGMCQIIPPSSWKCESKINEEMRFTAQVQHIHRLYKRWGPNVQFTSSVSKHLDTIGADLEPYPQIGGVEVDLCKLSRTIQEFGGMQNNVDKKKWVKIADAMKIPKLAQDRGMRLYDVYCKYLLPFDTLSAEEKTRVEQTVMSERQRKLKFGKVDDDDAIVKGKSNPLSTFIRVARNVRSMWFKDQPTAEQVESEYWRVLEDRNHHVSVQCGHVSTSTQGSGFPSKKDSPYSRHGWNLNNLSDNPKCILRCLGPISGATIPTLHIGMMFATSCWCTDIHHLPYIQYLHTGVDIVWYSIPKQQEAKFKAAMKDLVPSLVSDDPRWLKEDTVMVNPAHLTARGVSVARCVQKPKTFVAIFPKSYTATISCGYNVSESVHYAIRNWISEGVSVAEDLSKSVEPELFSMDALLSHLISDPTTDVQTLKVAVPFFEKVLLRELSQRKQLYDLGLKSSKRGGMLDDMPSPPSRKRSVDQTEDNVCDVSKKHCFFSKVVNDSENLTLSLEEGLKHVQKKKNLKHCKLNFRYTEDELKAMLQNAQCRLDISSSSDGGSSSKKRGTKK